MVKKIFWSFFEIFETVIIAVVAVVLVRTFIAQPFLVSGMSMEPAFENGDYLLVDELTYRFRDPQRGEVIVFNSPGGKSSYYIKRIIGLPGEELVVEDDQIKVYEDGSVEVLEEDYIPNQDLEKYKVSLDKNEYFVMGDNRNFSFDSRNWGPLEESRIVGVARLRLWPVSEARAIAPPTY